MFDFFNNVLEGDLSSILKLASVWCLFFGTKFLLELRTMEQWPSIVGDLHEFSVIGGPDASERVSAKVKTKYSFFVEDKEYKGKRLAHLAFGPSSGNVSLIKKMMAKVERPESGKVVIYYSPKKPQKSVLLRPGKIEYGLVCLCYVAAAFLMFIEPVGGSIRIL